MKLSDLEGLNEARKARRAAILVTDLDTNEGRLVEEGGPLEGLPFADEIAARFRSGASGTVTNSEGRSAFLTVNLPPPRLLVIGAVHISQALAPMARVAGFDMTVIDPRTGFATQDRFPRRAADRGVAGCSLVRGRSRPVYSARGIDPRSQDRRRGPGCGAPGGLFLSRCTWQQKDPWQANGAPERGRRQRRRIRPHSRADRSCHRCPVAGRDCGRDPGSGD